MRYRRETMAAERALSDVDLGPLKVGLSHQHIPVQIALVDRFIVDEVDLTCQIWEMSQGVQACRTGTAPTPTRCASEISMLPNEGPS